MNKKDKNEEKKTFKELWANKQTKAIIKLGMWFAFFFFLFLILSIISLFTDEPIPKDVDKKNEIIEEKVEANIINLLNKLNSSNYSYEYKIVNENDSYIYSGTKDNDTNSGFYQKNNDIYKYQVIEGIFYKVNNGELTDEIILNEMDQPYLKLDNIISTIKTYEENNRVIIENDVYTYNVSANYIISIEKVGNNINNINIKVDNTEYIMNFKNIVNE